MGSFRKPWIWNANLTALHETEKTAQGIAKIHESLAGNVEDVGRYGQYNARAEEETDYDKHGFHK